jgi:RNA polymerase sigma-70 factor (ECF subfamily)
MSDSASKSAVKGSGANRFATTRWSVVLAAGRRSTARSRDALAALCANYWYPLYGFVRAQGYSAHDAQDLTQEFFARLIEQNTVGEADRNRGRFRTFLIASLKHFLANERDRAQAKKRGGGRLVLSIDFDAGENRLGREPAHDATPERIFERRWAIALLETVLALLRKEFQSAGKGQLFERLKGTLTAPRDAGGYAAIAAELGMAAGAVKVAAHRLRRRYRELLRDEIAQTVASPDDIDQEIRELFTALDA